MARAGDRNTFPCFAAPSRFGLVLLAGVTACSSPAANNDDGDSTLVPFQPAGQGGGGSVDDPNAVPTTQGGSSSDEPNYDPIGISGASNSPPPGGSGAAGVQNDPAPTETPVLENVLVFSRTAGYRHDAIAPGIEAIRGLGASNGFAVEASEEPSIFNDAKLGEFDVVIWLSTTGDVLTGDQQAAFERYIRAGGSWVGVHAASDTEYDWAWYGQLLGGGAYFVSHPVIQTVTLNVEAAAAAHASTAHLPASFQLEDEWYNFRVNPRSAVNVLMTLDEGSYQPGADAMGPDHPIAWYHEFEGGRAWYTALGHRQELYEDALFTGHLLGGIRWAAGVVP